MNKRVQLITWTFIISTYITVAWIVFTYHHNPYNGNPDRLHRLGEVTPLPTCESVGPYRTACRLYFGEPYVCATAPATPVDILYWQTSDDDGQSWQAWGCPVYMDRGTPVP